MGMGGGGGVFCSTWGGMCVFVWSGVCGDVWLCLWGCVCAWLHCVARVAALAHTKNLYSNRWVSVCVQILVHQLAPPTQPLDAMAAAMDGCLQGATDYRWVSAQMTVASLASYAAILISVQMQGGLPGLWAGLRVIAVVRVVAGLWRLRSGRARVMWTYQVN